MLYVVFGVLLLGLIMFVFLRGKSGLEREIERKMKLVWSCSVGVS